MRLLHIFLILLLPVFGFGQNIKLSLTGSISNVDNGRGEPGVVITIIQNGSTIGTVTTGSSGSFSIVKQMDSKIPFKIVISKPQFVSKFITCDFSKLNIEDRQGGNQVDMPLNGSIFSVKPNLDFSFLDNEPIMKWSVDGSSGEPMLDEQQFRTTKKKIESLLKQADDQSKNNKKEYDKVMAQAETLYKGDKLEEALPLYEKATQLMPKETMPSERIEAIEKILQQRKADKLANDQANAGYKKLLDEGEALKTQKKYPEAIAKYEQAQEMKADDPFPTQQINIIKGLQKEIDNDVKYKELIAAGDGFYKQASYKVAKDKYLAAKKIKADDPVLNQKIADVQKKLDELAGAQANKQKYDDAIAAADGLRDQKQWAKAIEKYKEALAIESASDYATTEMKKCQTALDAEAKEKEKTEKIAKLLAEGATLMAANKFVEAKASYKQVQGLEPTNAEAAAKLEQIRILEEEAKSNSLKDQQFNKFVLDGDQADKTGDLKNAQGKYEEALKLKKDPSVEAKLENVKKRIIETSAKNEQAQKYKDAMATANALLMDKKYTEAKTAFQKASEIDNSKEEPKKKIAEIEVFIAQENQKLQNAAKFNDLITQGQNLKNNGNLEEAKAKYEEAKTLDKLSTIPQERITEINELIKKQAAEKQTKEQISKLLAEGNDLYGKQDWTNAKAKYEAVQKLDNSNAEANAKLKEISDKLAAQQGEAEKKNQFLKFKAEGLTLAKDGKYALAQAKLLEAKSYGSDKETEDKIKELEGLIANESAKQGIDTQYKKIIEEAQSFEATSQWKDALAKYQAAHALKENETLPIQKIGDMNTKIAELGKQNNNDKQYQVHIAKGDELFASKQYIQAIQEYNKAHLLKPEANEPKDKAQKAEEEAKRADDDEKKQLEKTIQAALKSLDEKDFTKAEELANRVKNNRFNDPRPEQILNRVQAEKTGKEVFSVYLKEAEGHEKARNYKAALVAYQTALGYDKDNKNVLAKVSEMQQILEKENNAKNADFQKQKHYADLVNIADKEFDGGKGSLPVSKAKYQNILIEYPNDAYANSQIAKIDALLNPVVQEVGTLEPLGDPFDSSIGDGTYALQRAEQERKHLNAAIINDKKDKLINVDSNLVDTDAKEINENMAKMKYYQSQTDSLQHRGNEHNLRNVDTIASIRKANEEKLGKEGQYKYNDNLNAHNEINTYKVNSELIDTTYAESNYKNLKDVKRVEIENVNNAAAAKQEETTLSNKQIVTKAENHKMVEAENREEVLQNNTQVLKTTQDDLGDQQNAAYNNEMVKYLKNKTTIENHEKDQMVIAGEESVKNQNNTAVINNVKAKSEHIHDDINDKDQQDQINSKKKLTDTQKEVEDKSKVSTAKQDLNSEKVKSMNNEALANEQKNAKKHENKQTNNKQKIDQADNFKKEQTYNPNTLGEDYPEGVTEEKFVQKDNFGLLKAVITRRIVVTKGEGNVYVKTETSAGATYSKNGKMITESAWISETQDAKLIKNP